MIEPPSRPSGHNARLLEAALVVKSGIIWCAVRLANSDLLSATRIAPRIDLVFLPAGLRLLIVIVFGIWGRSAYSSPIR